MRSPGSWSRRTFPRITGSSGGNRVVISYEQGRREPTFVLHEMGHALGLDHSWSANPDVVYGDRWDLMSAMNVWRFAGAFDESADPNSGPGLNAPNLARLGDPRGPRLNAGPRTTPPSRR